MMPNAFYMQLIILVFIFWYSFLFVERVKYFIGGSTVGVTYITKPTASSKSRYLIHIVSFIYFDL